VVVFTERDRKAIIKLAQQAPIVKIPLGTDIPECIAKTADQEPLSLLFVGNFRHMPNLDAAERLIHKIFPQVQSRFPNARLYIVGDHLPSNLLQEANENIILTGYVPDVVPYIQKATLVVAPLRLGGGRRVKVLEALAAGKAIVASSRAVDGLDLVNGEHVILAENDHEFVEAIVDLLGNEEKQRLVAGRARDWAQVNLSWQRVASVYELLYRNLLKC
jgi:glycosyltransferase involved in cell wall biosynthesis